MRTIVILAAIALLCTAPSATAAPEAPSELEGPEPVELHSCFNGGVTVVVYGRVVAECLGG